MKRQQLAPQGTIDRIRNQARIAWERRDLGQCIELLHRANRLAPADTWVLLQLGRIYGLRYEYDLAEEYFQRAHRVASPEYKTEILAGAGQQARDFYRKDIAIRYLEQAAQEKDVAPEALVRLAEVYERHRRLDDAIRTVDRVLQRNRNCLPAQLVHGRLTQRAGRLDEAERILRPLTQTADPSVRVRAGYELGTVLDRLGRYDEAMNAFVDAKAILRREAAPHLAQWQRCRAEDERTRQSLSPEILQSWSDKGHELRPQSRIALLCGHPRSGTTLLEQVLDAHPDMLSAEETNNFVDYVHMPMHWRAPEGTPTIAFLNEAPTDQLLGCRANYLRAMELCLGEPLQGRLLIDKNPSLTFMLPSFVRVFPESRFLVAIRDPRDVCLSCFMQPFLPIHMVASAFLDLEHTVREYASLMGTWCIIAPMLPNPTIQVRYEDMVEDLESTVRKTLEFLRVPWDESVLRFYSHAKAKVVRSPTYADVTQQVFKRAQGRWRNYQKYLEPHLPVLEPFVKAFGYE